MESRKEPSRNRIPGGRKPSSATGNSRPARKEQDGFSGKADRAYVRKKSEGTEGERPRGKSKMVSKDYGSRPERDSDANRARPKGGGSTFSRGSKPGFGSRKSGFNRSEDRPGRTFSDGESRSSAGRPSGSYPDSENRSERPSRFNKTSEGRPAQKRPIGARSSEDRPFRPKPGFKKPFGAKDSEDRPFRPKPGFKKAFGSADSEGRADRPSFSKKPFGPKNTDEGEKRGKRFSNEGNVRPSRPSFQSAKPRPPLPKEEETSERKFKPAFKPKHTEEGESTAAKRPRTDSKTSRPGKTYGHNRKPRFTEGDNLGEKGIRLNKYLANAGLCSRREADQFIETGVVEVNGEIITELGHKIQHDDVVLFGGKRVNGDKPTYVLLNKPKDYISTTRDPEQRKTVMELIGNLTRSRVFPVGRLDRNTTGVLILTNDGDLADRLLHPSRKIGKVYHVEVDKRFKIKDLNALKTGIELEDGFIQVDDASLVEGGTPMQIGIQIHSGRNRIVRRMIEHLGYEVIKLDRVMFAGLTKKGLKRGQARFLTEEEVIMLRRQ